LTTNQLTNTRNILLPSVIDKAEFVEYSLEPEYVHTCMFNIHLRRF